MVNIYPSRKTIYVGMDNSNHAGKTSGEIIVAISSLFHEDSIVKNFGTKRCMDYKNWLYEPNKKRIMKFGVLKDEKFRHIHQNIPCTAKELTDKIIEELSICPEEAILKLYIDGPVKMRDKQRLRDEFKEYSGFTISNFVKKMGVHHCPKLVYMADIIARDLYTSGFNHIFEHPCYVPLSSNPNP